MSTWFSMAFDSQKTCVIHAAGCPRAIFTDGEHLGWADQGGVYMTDEEQCLFFPIANIDDLVVSPERWVIRQGNLLHWGKPGFTNWQQRALPSTEVILGHSHIAYRMGAERIVETLDGQPLKLPHTASNARPRPDGTGFCWHSSRTLYRQFEDGLVQAVDAIAGPIKDWFVGPMWTNLFALRDGRVVASNNGRLFVTLAGSPDITDACVSIDGNHALLRVSEGTALYDLNSGEQLGIYEGVAPVALSPVTALLEEDTGELLSPDGDLLLPRFFGGPAILSDDLLVGPGAAAWSLSEGIELFTGPPLAAEELLISSDTIYCIHHDEVALIDRETGTELQWLSRPEGFPVIAGDTLLFVQQESMDDDDEPMEDDGPPRPQAVPLPVTASHTTNDRCWFWNDAGLLVSVASEVLNT